jgi:cell pole-organizing protein PopZ
VIKVDKRRILIVANQTAAGSHLKGIVQKRISEGPCSFLLLVPAHAPPDKLTWTDEEAWSVANTRMNEALTRLRETGADIEGQVEEGSPMDAVTALMQIEQHQAHESFDEIILSTLPPGMSHWLKQDLPHRLERRFEISITHVVGDPEAERAT